MVVGVCKRVKVVWFCGGYALRSSGDLWVVKSCSLFDGKGISSRT